MALLILRILIVVWTFQPAVVLLTGVGRLLPQVGECTTLF